MRVGAWKSKYYLFKNIKYYFKFILNKSVSLWYEPCHSNCKTCSGSNSNECDTCDSAFNRELFSIN